MPSRSSRASSRRQRRRTRTLRSRWTRAPSSSSSSRRAAVPISRTFAPPRPIRIAFCDSDSAQTSARTTVTRPSSRRAHLARPRPRPSGGSPRGSGSAPARGSARRAAPRWPGRCAPRADRGRGPPASARSAARSARSRPVAGAGADREDLVDRLELGRRRRAPPRWSPGRRRSILLTAQITGDRAVRRRAGARAMKRSPGPTPSSPLRTSSATSESASSRSTRRCIRSVSTSRGRCTPGRSTSTSCQPASRSVATPRTARRVVCGRSETIATRAPTIALTSVDLPTFGRPARPTKPARVIAAAQARAIQDLRLQGRASRRRRSRGRSRRGGASRGPRPR